MHYITEDTKSYMYKMVSRSLEPEPAHVCGPRCLGRLTFHREAVGALVSLSQGARRADRTGDTFRHGLVFSSRPVQPQERVRLRVERCGLNWCGAMRIGFTTVPPIARDLPSMAIPDLTNIPGHWAAPVPETCCHAGSELEFWVSNGGTLYFRNANGRQHKLLEGVDLSWPLWAMIDVYGQTCSVLLLGSEKKCFLSNQKSCPAPQRHSSCSAHQRHALLNVDEYVNVKRICDDSHDRYLLPCPANKQTSDCESVEDCAVCMSHKACISLRCGHQCLCHQCFTRVIQEFGTCPLCRQNIKN
ncbi:E3 ubiquitin-protein ligase LINCR [Salmo salar]|uniref:E3 ubiquitin-protein ligase LINCR n=1 Tax=Salmo salar TaxID=8030 RepID=B5X7U3_SALSA|nr:E3 ubiquitin-protein ligase LINCR [Salmo salar]ACI66913.1 E3 ubiquitin-protein ligase LINCR [Salmo salar]|eukprot:NP_001134285.1 E3 ubiquitin-protein ligase LINCR [Salmo salar]